jgi:cystathionine beta-lyase
MSPNFDEIPNRRGSDSSKWTRYEPDVLPLFVADMDFRAPDAVIRALHERVEHGYFGYVAESTELKDIVCERLSTLYQWQVRPEHILFVPGLISGLNLAARAVGQPGDGVLINTPVYHPFLHAIQNQERTANIAQLRYRSANEYASYEIDFDAIEAAVTARTRLFMLCNPHNPVGRVYQRRELERLADAALRHNFVICSDEIHSDILYDGNRHLPIAALAPEIAERCITLMAPSKSFNLPGLGCGFAITRNPELMKQLKRAGEGITGHYNPMGFAAAIAAYREGQPWLDDLLKYLTANRDFLAGQIAEHFPTMRMTKMEGTYLAWLDCREMNLPGVPAEFFLKEARVGLTDGAMFGPGGEGFARLCIASPRAMLAEGMERMAEALARMAYR